MSIEFNGKKYELFRDISESDKIFKERCDFIKFVNSNKLLLQSMKKENEKQLEWKTIDKYSKIHINIKYLECKYPHYTFLKVNKISELFNKVNKVN